MRAAHIWLRREGGFRHDGVAQALMGAVMVVDEPFVEEVLELGTVQRASWWVSGLRWVVSGRCSWTGAGRTAS